MIFFFSIVTSVVLATTPAELTQLLRDFSNPLMRDRSEPVLKNIFAGINEMVSRKNFMSARNFVSQLEAARIGRSPTLGGSREKQFEDRQMVCIWEFMANFYRACGQFEKDRGFLEEAKSYFQAAEKNRQKLKTALKKAKKKKISELQVIEEETPPGCSPDDMIYPSLVNIPTSFFYQLPVPVSLIRPYISPFRVIPENVIKCKMILSEKWLWSVSFWPGSLRTWVIGFSGMGDCIIWVAGSGSKNRPVECFIEGGNWIVSANEKEN